MDLTFVIGIVVLFFVFLVIIFYYGITLNLISTFALATLISLIVLNLFFPPSRLITLGADPGILIYCVLQILGILYLIFYIFYCSVFDIRKSCCSKINNYCSFD